MTDSIICTPLPGLWFAAARFFDNAGRLTIGLRGKSPELVSLAGPFSKFFLGVPASDQPPDYDGN
jgi:hypothetical protein